MRALHWMAAVAVLFAFTPAAAPSESDPAFIAAAKLHRGMNVLGYDPIWYGPRAGYFQYRHFQVIRKGGFDFVRVAFRAFEHMDNENRIHPRALAVLDRVVAEASAAGLRVIIDEHDFRPCGTDPETCETKLAAFWEQVAPRFRSAPSTVMFEPLNEPYGGMSAQRWNALLPRIIKIIRKTNPRRTLVVGPAPFNSIKGLTQLKLPPKDRNIIVTIHYYQPARFTLQGLESVAKRGGVLEHLETRDLHQIDRDFEIAVSWAKIHRRPLLLGEFGVDPAAGISNEERAEYARAVCHAAESHRIPWAYYQFNKGFDAFDTAYDRWIEPIREALIRC